MPANTTRVLLILEAVLIATPISGLAILESGLLLDEAIRFPRLWYTLALGVLALISLSSIVSGWRLFIVFLRGGQNKLQSQHFGWWSVILVGVLVLVGSLISNLLPPSPEYSYWAAFRFSYNGFVLGSPLLIPFCHLAIERFLRR